MVRLGQSQDSEARKTYEEMSQKYTNTLAEYQIAIQCVEATANCDDQTDIAGVVQGHRARQKLPGLQRLLEDWASRLVIIQNDNAPSGGQEQHNHAQNAEGEQRTSHPGRSADQPVHQNADSESGGVVPRVVIQEDGRQGIGTDTVVHEGGQQQWHPR